MLKENFIFAQQQLFANALSQYTSTLNAQDAQAIQNMQKDMVLLPVPVHTQWYHNLFLPTRA